MRSLTGSLWMIRSAWLTLACGVLAAAPPVLAQADRPAVVVLTFENGGS